MHSSKGFHFNGKSNHRNYLLVKNSEMLQKFVPI